MRNLRPRRGSTFGNSGTQYRPTDSQYVDPHKHKSPAAVAGLSARTGTKNSGSPIWARTRDNLINSQVLYGLSYRGINLWFIDALVAAALKLITFPTKRRSRILFAEGRQSWLSSPLFMVSFQPALVVNSRPASTGKTPNGAANGRFSRRARRWRYHSSNEMPEPVEIGPATPVVQ